MEEVIKVKGLIKKYGDFTAVNGVTFSVEKGEIFGLLGENGAGKTTTLEIIEGLRSATKGLINMLGEDVSRGCKNNIKERIGVQLQSSAYFNFLTLKEILELFASFYGKSLPVNDLLEMVNLEEKADSLVGNLSGGQKQRFSIIASLINDPEIVFLDEPTTGLDPLARRNLWDLIVKIKSQGKTIILTTHYMEEAEVLCDRIAIMDHGEILTIGKTHKLIEQTKKPYKLSFVTPSLTASDTSKLKNLGEITNLAGKSGHYEMHLKTQADLSKSIDIIQKLTPESLTVGRASLEDLFIELTGRNIEE
jgi:ABC-2 type transport system ATP-binding protein